MTTTQLAKPRQFTDKDYETMNVGMSLPRRYCNDPQVLFGQLNYWLTLPKWTAAQAAALIAGKNPRGPSKDTLEILGNINIPLSASDNIPLSVSDVLEKVCIRRAREAEEKILDAAKSHDYDNLSPSEWLSFAMRWDITPGWRQFAIDEGLLQIEEAPPTSTAITAPGDKVGAVPVVERSITKQRAINEFEGLHLDRNGWNNALSDVPKWIEPCRVSRGRKGDKSTSATWNPVLIAAALSQKDIPIKKLDAVFVRLTDWAEDWRETSALFRD